jgi:hypothetical protein
MRRTSQDSPPAAQPARFFRSQSSWQELSTPKSELCMFQNVWVRRNNYCLVMLTIQGFRGCGPNHHLTSTHSEQLTGLPLRPSNKRRETKLAKTSEHTQGSFGTLRVASPTAPAPCMPLGSRGGAYIVIPQGISPGISSTSIKHQKGRVAQG